MAARARVIEAGEGAQGGHPCFMPGASLKYSYGGKTYDIGEVVEAGEFKKCAAVALKALEHDKACWQPQVCRTGGRACTWR